MKGGTNGNISKRLRVVDLRDRRDHRNLRTIRIGHLGLHDHRLVGMSMIRSEAHIPVTLVLFNLLLCGYYIGMGSYVGSLVSGFLVVAISTMMVRDR